MNQSLLNLRLKFLTAIKKPSGMGFHITSYVNALSLSVPCMFLYCLPRNQQLPGHTLCFQQEESQETFQFLCLPVQWIYISLINTTSKMLSPEPHESHRFLEQLRIPLHFE